MKFQKLKNANKREIIESKNNAFMIALAFICALVSWYYIKMKYYASETKLFNNVEVTAETDGTTAGDNDLMVINNLPSVSVSLNCSTKDFTRINKNSIVAYVDLNNLSLSGTYPLTIKVKPLSDDIEIISYTVNPPIANVELDKFAEKTLNLSADVSKIEVSEDRAKGDPVCDPAEITISGPSRIINTIDKVVAVSDSSEVLDTTKIIDSDRFVFYTEDDTVRDDSKITLSKKTVSITVPVFAQKTVPIVASFQTTDTNFDTSSLDYTITPNTIMLASENGEKINDTCDVKIPLTDLVDGSSIVYEKDYPIKTQYINQSQLETVHFKLNNPDLALREITLSKNNIHKMQIPQDNYDYSIETEKITVKLIGPQDVINNITASDIDANVNLTNAESEKLVAFPIDVEVSCSENYKNVFAVADQKVNIKKTPKTERAPAATTRPASD